MIHILLFEERKIKLIIKSLQQIINNIIAVLPVSCPISIKVSAFDHVLQHSLSIINSHRDETETKSNGK